MPGGPSSCTRTASRTSSAASSTSPAGRSRRSSRSTTCRTCSPARALHAAGDGRPRRDDTRRGRVRRHARPVDAADAAVGPTVRVDAGRPLLRRPGAVRALHPLDPQAAARPSPPSWASVQPRRRDRDLRVPGVARPRPRRSCPWPPAATMRPTQAYDVEATIDAMPFLDPMVTVHEQTGFGVFCFDARRRRRAVRVRLRLRDALEMADQLTLFRLDGAAGRQAVRTGRDVHAQAVHRGWGSGAPLQHEPRRPRDRRQPVPRRRRRPAARAGASPPTGSSPASCATPGRSPPGDADGQLLQAARPAPRRRHRLVGAGVGGVRRQQPLVHAAPAAQPAGGREPRRRLRRQHLPRRRLHARRRARRHRRGPRPRRAGRGPRPTTGVGKAQGRFRRRTAARATCSRRSRPSRPTRSCTRCSRRSS